MIEGSLEAYFKTAWKLEKQRRKVDSEEQKYKCGKVRRKKTQSGEMLGNPARKSQCFSNDFWFGKKEKSR